MGVYFYDRGLCAPGDEIAVQAYRAKTGRLPAVWAIYQSWTGWNNFPVSQAQRARSLGAALMVTWEPWKGSHLNDPNWSCRAVAGGTYDAYIRSLRARRAGQWRAGRDALCPRDERRLVSLGHGLQRPLRTRTNGNTPADYVAMWRHVVDIFRAEGALNAQWAWSPNVIYLNGFNSYQRQSADLRALYPGDGYVDWVGVSVYNDGARPALEFIFPAL